MYQHQDDYLITIFTTTISMITPPTPTSQLPPCQLHYSYSTITRTTPPMPPTLKFPPPPGKLQQISLISVILSATEFSTNHSKAKQENVQQMSSLQGIKYKACPPVYSPCPNPTRILQRPPIMSVLTQTRPIHLYKWAKLECSGLNIWGLVNIHLLWIKGWLTLSPPN